MSLPNSYPEHLLKMPTVLVTDKEWPDDAPKLINKAEFEENKERYELAKPAKQTQDQADTETDGGDEAGSGRRGRRTTK